MPAVHEDLTAVPGAVPLLNGTGMRSVVTVPLKVEGRLTGSLGVAAEAPGRYSNEEALRLQFAADASRSPSSRPAWANWSACAAARSASSSRPPTCWPAPWTGTRPWP
ncbi:hypothetical protein GCM10023238_13170 [Streptomyces heliomycini]